MKFICLRRMIDKNRISMYNLYRFTFSIHFYFSEIFWYFSWIMNHKGKFYLLKINFSSDFISPAIREKTIHLIHLRFLQNIRDKGYSRNKGKIQPKNGFCNLISGYHI